MEQIAEQLLRLNEIKDEIKAALIYQGVDVKDDESLAFFPTRVLQIKVNEIVFHIKQGNFTVGLRVVEGSTFRTYAKSGRNTAYPFSIVTFGGQDLVLVKFRSNYDPYQVLGVTADTIITNETTYMLADEPFSPTISFTLRDSQGTHTCQAEEGMTWREWKNSSYNTLGMWLYKHGGNLPEYIVFRDDYIATTISIKNTSHQEVADDIIVANAQYEQYDSPFSMENDVWE